METGVDTAVENFIKHDKVPTKSAVFMQEEQHPAKLSVQEFYRGQTVLVTGGTGFLGGLLLEKLLRSCPGISAIYILVRERIKKEQDAATRIKKLLSSPVSKYSFIKLCFNHV